MKKNGTRYDEEFKEELIRLVKEEGRSIPKIAKDFGVNPQTLRNWVKKSSNDKNSGEESVESLKAQLKVEKRKIKDLETTVDILKKATSIFAKDNRN